MAARSSSVAAAPVRWKPDRCRAYPTVDPHIYDTLNPHHALSAPALFQPRALAAPALSWESMSMSLRRMIFPDDVVGSASVNTTARGRL